MADERSARSRAPITDELLRRLAHCANVHHRNFARAKPDWARNRLASCLVQGGARHRTHGDRGVKDLDVYVFYAVPSGANASRFPWNRNTVQVDLGPSELGRQLYTDDDRADPQLAKLIPRFEAFQGRRVDLMARAIASHRDGPQAAVRAWLTKGAKKRRSRPDASMNSDWHLARAPVVCLYPDLGAIWWEGPLDDEAGTEKGAYGASGRIVEPTWHTQHSVQR